MIRYAGLIATLLCSLTLIQAQPLPPGPDSLWVRFYTEADTAAYQWMQTEPTPDGGWVMIGFGFVLPGDTASVPCFLRKINAEGYEEWVRFYRMDQYLATYDVALTADGGYALCGQTYAWPAYSAVVLRVSATGDLLWSRRFSHHGIIDARSLAALPDDGLLVSGSCAFPDLRHHQLFLLRLTATGDTLWTRYYHPGDSADYDSWTGYLMPVEDGHFLMQARRADQRTDPYRWGPMYLKIDAEGDTLWTLFNPDTVDWGQWLPIDGCVMPDGTYLLMGGAGTDGCLTHMTPDGQVLMWGWLMATLGRPAVDPQGGFVIPIRDYDETFLVRFNLDGQGVWVSPMGFAHIPNRPLGWFFPFAAHTTADGGYVVSGQSFVGNMSDFSCGFLMRFAPEAAADPERLALRPQSVHMDAPTPNPFNATTTLTFTLPQPMDVELTVFDVLGRETAVLLSGRKMAGIHSVTFAGQGLPSGIYFVRLEAAGTTQTRKLMLLK